MNTTVEYEVWTRYTRTGHESSWWGFGTDASKARFIAKEMNDVELSTAEMRRDLYAEAGGVEREFYVVKVTTTREEV